jgi:hypothetical protein
MVILMHPDLYCGFEYRIKRNDPQDCGSFRIIDLVLAGATGFEPAVSALTGPHVSRYTTPPNFTKFIMG